MDHPDPLHVTVKERIDALLGENFHLGSDISFYYSWEAGYEKYRVQRAGEGSEEFSGSFHPRDICEGGGVCRYCGQTLLFS